MDGNKCDLIFWVIMVVGIVLSFLPLLLDIDYELGQSSMGAGLLSYSCRRSMTAVVFSSIPTFLDSLLDCLSIFSKNNTHSPKSQKYLRIKTLIPLSAIICFGYLNHRISLIESTHQTFSESGVSSIAVLFLCIYSVEKIIILSSTLYLLSLADSSIWTNGRVLLIQTCILVQSVLSSLVVKRGSYFVTMSAVVHAFGYIVIFLTFFLCLFWFYRRLLVPWFQAAKQRRKENITNNDDMRRAQFRQRSFSTLLKSISVKQSARQSAATTNKATLLNELRYWNRPDHLYCAVSVFNIILMFAALWIVWEVHHVHDLDWANHNITANCLATVIYLFTAVVITSTLMPTRYVRAELVASKVRSRI
jgi:hypothetical protein